MIPAKPAAWQELEKSLDDAIEMAKQARYADLTAQAEVLGRNATGLAGLRAEISRPGSDLDLLRKACERIRRKILVLAELFRHASATQSGLLGLHQTITTPYAASGRLPASRNPFALCARVDSEA